MWRSVAAWLTLGGALLTSACSSEHSYKYRVTVEVDTPDGPRMGSAVRQVRWRAGTKITPEADTAFMAHQGEAVVVELPDANYLFALPSPDGEETPRRAFGSSALKPPFEDGERVLSPPERPEADYGRSGYPRLVRFTDLADPKSVRAVDPRDLVASFGPGYRLKAITVQITDESPTKGVIRKLLPWMDTYRNMNFSGSRYHNIDDIRRYGVAAKLGRGDFIQGDTQ